MNYTLHNVRKKTREWLNTHYPHTKNGSIVQIGSRNINRFVYENNTWYRQKSIVQPKPAFIYQIVYGDFAGKGGIGCVIKIPGKHNWHKNVGPALARIVKQIAIKEKPDYYLDYADESLYNGKNYLCFAYDNESRSFVEDKTVV